MNIAFIFNYNQIYGRLKAVFIRYIQKGYIEEFTRDALRCIGWVNIVLCRKVAYKSRGRLKLFIRYIEKGYFEEFTIMRKHGRVDIVLCRRWHNESRGQLKLFIRYIEIRICRRVIFELQ